MDKNKVIELERRVIASDTLTGLLKEGARKLLSQAAESEVQDLLAKTSRLCACLLDSLKFSLLNVCLLKWYLIQKNISTYKIIYLYDYNIYI